MSDIVEKITHAFEEEHRDSKTGTTGTQLPLSYESMSPVWLTEILCKNEPDIKITSFELGPEDSGSTNRRKVKIHYSPQHQRETLPAKVFCKATHKLENRLLTGIFGAVHAEVTFYNKIRPHLSIETPTCYFAEHNDHTHNSMIILEDISRRVESFCSHRTPINKTRSESQISLLAKLHSSFHQSEALKSASSSLHTWPDFFENAKRFNLEEASNRGFLSAQEVIPQRLYKDADRIWEKIISSIEEHRQLPATITHNDVHLGNWYLLPGDVMGLCDWGCCTIGHWSRDLAYTIATGLTIEDRRRWEKDLIQLYLHLLAENGAPKVSFDTAWDLYRRQLFSVLPWWTVTYSPEKQMPENMQPADMVKEFIRRLTVAIDDLDAVKLF